MLDVFKISFQPRINSKLRRLMHEIVIFHFGGSHFSFPLFFVPFLCRKSYLENIVKIILV